MDCRPLQPRALLQVAGVYWPHGPLQRGQRAPLRGSGDWDVRLRPLVALLARGPAPPVLWVQCLATWPQLATKNKKYVAKTYCFKLLPELATLNRCHHLGGSE